MKIVYVALAAAGLAAAHPHQHGHAHLHEKRDSSPTVDVVTVPGPTVVMYSLNGNIISKEQVDQGIADGTLVWANGAPTISGNTNAAVVQKAAAAPAPAATTSQDNPPAAATTQQASTSSPSASASSSSASASTGLDSDFPDGQLDCSTFPSQYGAVALDYLNLGGWSGIQQPGSNGFGTFNDIETIHSGECSEGNFCSYACPPGYQKTQWPSVQGATGQSVGGLQCSGGKLQLTNSGLSSKLCMQGVQQVNVQIQNQLSQNVAVCRTDYPGTESETIPLNVAAGGTSPLTCPDEANYFEWQGLGTSAQYYVNPAGVSTEDACQWGSSSSPTGNWAPLNIGVGWSSGRAYVSMFPNTPTTTSNLSYKVSVSADSSGESCTYENGAFTSNVGDSSNGCTISASSGTITYIFSN